MALGRSVSLVEKVLFDLCPFLYSVCLWILVIQ
uniref:Uncharacterized protein n=1 Tax=Arundo donax TaxID=35708 RepID=A0A0A9F159_ARUDO